MDHVCKPVVQCQNPSRSLLFKSATSESTLLRQKETVTLSTALTELDVHAVGNKEVNTGTLLWVATF